MEKIKCIEKLAKIIEDNPDCEIIIDNDCWSIFKNESKRIDEDTKLTYLAYSDNYEFHSDWYSDSNIYGAGVADVLVYLLNKRGFKIKAKRI